MRMTDLAHRALISRSGVTRRVARLVGEGLVQRGSTGADARRVVTFTEAGDRRLLGTASVHLREVHALFVQRLDDEELAVLGRSLSKVTLDCSFG
jgi:DNA-binding MarR family transcriptional regulator